MSKIAYILVGLPGSGKSTFIKNEILAKAKEGEVWHIVSSDDIIEEWGAAKGLAYNEAWKEFSGKAKGEMVSRLKAAIEAGSNLVFDLTNMTVKSRKAHLKRLTADYTDVRAVVWSLTDVELKARQDKREKETGKSIPGFVVNNMARSYEAPTKDEGFTEVRYIR